MGSQRAAAALQPEPLDCQDDSEEEEEEEEGGDSYDAVLAATQQQPGISGVSSGGMALLLERLDAHAAPLIIGTGDIVAVVPEENADRNAFWLLLADGGPEELAEGCTIGDVTYDAGDRIVRGHWLDRCAVCRQLERRDVPAVRGGAGVLLLRNRRQHGCEVVVRVTHCRRQGGQHC